MLQCASRHPLFASLQREAAKALAALHQEIAQHEQELAMLKAEAARWKSAVRGAARRVSLAAAPLQASPFRQSQVDWSIVLTELPAWFTTKDVAQQAGKPIAQIYVHLSRWMKDKKVRRVKDGYQRTSRTA